MIIIPDSSLYDSHWGTKPSACWPVLHHHHRGPYWRQVGEGVAWEPSSAKVKQDRWRLIITNYFHYQKLLYDATR